MQTSLSLSLSISPLLAARVKACCAPCFFSYGQTVNSGTAAPTGVQSCSSTPFPPPILPLQSSHLPLPLTTTPRLPIHPYLATRSLHPLASSTNLTPLHPIYPHSPLSLHPSRFACPTPNSVHVMRSQPLPPTYFPPNATRLLFSHARAHLSSSPMRWLAWAGRLYADSLAHGGGEATFSRRLWQCGFSAAAQPMLDHARRCDNTPQVAHWRCTSDASVVLIGRAFI